MAGKKVKLNKEYSFPNGNGRKIVPAFTEVELTDVELANVSKSDIVRPEDEKK